MATVAGSTSAHATLSGATADLVIFGSVQVITLTGFGAGDSFKVQYANATTASIAHGSASAAQMQTAIRSLTGDTGLTVTGTDNAGPYTVTFVDLRGPRPNLDLVELTGVTAVTTNTQATLGRTLRVTNRHATNDMYFNYNVATVPTAAADDVVYVKAGDSAVVTPGGQIYNVRLVGTDNPYSVSIA